MNNKSTRYSCTHVWPTFTLHQFHISHPYKNKVTFTNNLHNLMKYW